MRVLDKIVYPVVVVIIGIYFMAGFNSVKIKAMLLGLTAEHIIFIAFVAIVVGLIIFELTRQLMKKKYIEKLLGLENAEKVKEEYEDKLNKNAELTASYKAELDRRDQEDQEIKDIRAILRYKKSNESQ